MKIYLIYPKWKKLKHQPAFNLPPHAPVCLAAEIASDIQIDFCDENVEEINWNNDCDLIMLSVMLTSQIKRAWAIAENFRKKGKKIIFGGIASALHYKETLSYADSIFLGEIEGRSGEIIRDFRSDSLKKIYDHLYDPVDIRCVKTARRDILNQNKYQYRGVAMPALVHASRGCIFGCKGCASEFLGGKGFRPRPVEKVVEELEGINNNKIFFVDNTLAQDKEWLLKLFKSIKPLNKKWISHPLLDDDEVLAMAKEAGCWYVYQAVWGMSDSVKTRLSRYKKHGIAVETAVTIGLDFHDEEYIKMMIGSLIDIGIDLAEISINTPYPHTRLRAEIEAQGRLLSNDWDEYTADQVVFKPALITPEKLTEMYDYCWNAFYGISGKEIRMAKLFNKIR